MTPNIVLPTGKAQPGLKCQVAIKELSMKDYGNHHGKSSSDAVVPKVPQFDRKITFASVSTAILMQSKIGVGWIKKITGCLMISVLIFSMVTLSACQNNVATVSKQNNNISEREYVDLGLSVKWATRNVGASSPFDYGEYYAWGETTTKASYTEGNSQTYGKSMGDIGGNPTYDVARANWGGSWRLPTSKEMHELIDNCTWTWTTQGGSNGYKVTSKKNGESIFLPAAGWRGSKLNYDGQRGNYWTSTPYDGDASNAYSLSFGSSDHYTYWNVRNHGRSVRPVSE